MAGLKITSDQTGESPMNDKLSHERIMEQIIEIKMPQEMIKRVRTHCEKHNIPVDEFILHAVAEKLAMINKERRKKQRL